MTDLVGGPVGESDLAGVRGVGLFAALSPEVLSRLLAPARTIVVPPFRVLFTEDQEADQLFVVVAGMVGTLVGSGTQAACLIALAGPGEIVGDAGLFDTGRHPVTAQAITEARLVAIPAAAVLSGLEADGVMRRRMLAFLSFRLRALVGQIGQLKLMSAAQRLGLFLAGLAGSGPGPRVLRLACERRVIAGMLGMTPECLSRSLGQLRPMGVTSRGRWEIVVEDGPRLRAFATGEQA